jgi:hypothetical protein
MNDQSDVTMRRVSCSLIDGLSATSPVYSLSGHVAPAYTALIMARDFAVHIFVRMRDELSVYLCGADPSTVNASVAAEWADQFSDDMMCAECLRLLQLSK